MSQRENIREEKGNWKDRTKLTRNEIKNQKKVKTAKNNPTSALKFAFRHKVVCCDCDMI